MHTRRSQTVSSACILLLGVLWCVAAVCQPEEEPVEDPSVTEKLSSLTGMTTPEKVDFRFDEGERAMDNEGPVYKIWGNVWFSDGVTELRADEAVYYETQQIVEAHGNITLTQESGVITADYAMYDFLNETGVLENVHGDVTPFRFSAPKLEQVGPGEAVVENPSITTCDPDDKLSYRVTAPQAEYRDGSVMRLRHALVYLGPVPIFYWPKVAYRQGATRANLELKAGSESELGQFVRVGLNFSPVKDVDLTLRTDGYTRAGYGFGLDGQFDIFKPELDPDKNPEILHKGGHGEFITYLAKDDRGRVQAYYRHEFPDDWVLLAQVEHWSEKKFLKEFYYDEFKERTGPESLVNITKTWEDVVFSSTVRKQVTGYTEDVNRLPEARVDVGDIPFFDNTFTLSFDESISYLHHRPHGPESARSHSSGRLALTPLSRSGMAIVPYIGGSRNWYSRTPGRRGDHGNAGYETGVAGSVRAHKAYPSFLDAYTELKHVILPTVTTGYNSTPRHDMDEHFFFDADDESFRYGRVNVQIDNRVIGKTEDGVNEELLRWVLYGGSDFTSRYRTTRDWESLLEVRPVDWIKLISSIETHRGDFDFSRADAGLVFGTDTDPLERMFEIKFVYEDTDIETLNRDLAIGFGTRLGEKYKISAEHRYDFEDSKLESQEYMIERDLGCFIGSIGFRKRRESTDVYAVLTIEAFPGEKVKF